MYKKTIQFVMAVINVTVGVCAIGSGFAALAQNGDYGVFALSAIIGAIFLPVGVLALRVAKDSDMSTFRKKRLRRNAICAAISVLILVFALLVALIER